jgi:hypothetical protein
MENIKPEAKKEPTHIYEWLDHPELLTTEAERMVHKFLEYKTLPASEQYKPENKAKVQGLNVFCEYKGIKYKIMGASRLGDVWLAENFNRDNGYDNRVGIDECTNFSFTQE